MLLEQNDEWAVPRARYITLEAITGLSDDPLVNLPLVAAWPREPTIVVASISYTMSGNTIRETQPLPKIGPVRERLDDLLPANAGNPAHERLTLVRVYEEIRALGYEAGTTPFVGTPTVGLRSAAP